MRALVLLLAAVALVMVAWALLVPPLQVPDEASHFGYVQSIAESLERPTETPPGQQPRFSPEEQAAGVQSRGLFIIQDPDLKPPWSRAADARWRRTARAMRGGGRGHVGGIGPQAANPPLYYAYEAIPYRLAAGGDFFDRLYVMRLWSGLLMLVTVAATWLLVGELTRPTPVLQLAGAACVGLQPMATFVSAGVNPDAGFFALTALALWLGVRTLRRGVSGRRAVALLAVALGAVLVKTTAVLFLPAVALALLVPAWRARRPREWPRGWRVTASLAGGCLLVGAAAFVATRGLRAHVDRPVPESFGDVRGFASYLWQFYLPGLPVQRHFAGLADLPAYSVWLKTSWAAFGWLEVRFPDAVYGLFVLIAVATFAGAGLALRRRPDPAVLAFFAVAVGGLLLGLHWLDYRALVGHGGARVQGRYLLPLMPIVGVAVAAAIANLRPRGRALATGGLLGGLVALQLLSLGIVAGRFYA